MFRFLSWQRNPISWTITETSSSESSRLTILTATVLLVAFSVLVRIWRGKRKGKKEAELRMKLFTTHALYTTPKFPLPTHSASSNRLDGSGGGLRESNSKEQVVIADLRDRSQI